MTKELTLSFLSYHTEKKKPKKKKNLPGGILKFITWVWIRLGSELLFMTSKI